MADIDDAFDQLYSSPERFMQTYYFKLTGAYDPPDPKTTSGPSIFRFSEIEYCAMMLHGANKRTAPVLSQSYLDR